MVRVLIADDHAIVRAGLRALIASEPSLELAGEAAGGYETIDLVERTRPDVLLLDISMPDL
ncbi:MAG: response regulator transcription factor, partial [Bryobacteraceae bacterium]